MYDGSIMLSVENENKKYAIGTERRMQCCLLLGEICIAISFRAFARDMSQYTRYHIIIVRDCYIYCLSLPWEGTVWLIMTPRECICLVSSFACMQKSLSNRTQRRFGLSRGRSGVFSFLLPLASRVQICLMPLWTLLVFGEHRMCSSWQSHCSS